MSHSMQIDEQAPVPTSDQIAKMQLGGPVAVIWDPMFQANLKGMDLHPWDVITGPEMAKAGGFSPRKMPDWRRSVTTVFLPDPEHKRLFAGPADYYRMDVLFDWIASRGTRETDRTTLWTYAADYLEKHNLGRPADAHEVEERLSWLWHHGILLPRVPSLKQPYHPYAVLAH